ncbi:AlpA family transcriptional regulator [Psychromonas antarctica]|uniref:AlpA family transcriptional regulator n=1 Tax=Psychromonas antarctica TaxID=67573 RepID=UPI001EE79C20|nr:AlpA family transcriptional regulator [Psychromonas antarctica]MCG6202755.1 AlpA family transcriptional regulator [Psychromonas antarctica]
MKIIRLKEVMNLCSLGRSTIYAKMACNQFPLNIKLGGHATGWIEDEVLDWINDCIQERNNQTEDKFASENNQ